MSKTFLTAMVSHCSGPWPLPRAQRGCDGRMRRKGRSLWPEEPCGFSGHCHAPAFEGVKHRNDLGNRELRFGCVEHDQVGRFIDGETVIDEAHYLGGATGHHVEALQHVGLLADLADIRIEVRHPDERAVAERCEWVEHVVAR